MSKKKLLWISDSAAFDFIGQSVVARECLERLQKDYEVEQLGFNHSACTTPTNLPYNIISCMRSDMMVFDGKRKNEKGEEVRVGLRQYIEQSNPDVILFSHDPFMITCLDQCKKAFPHIKYLGYLTMDGDPAFYGWYPLIKPYDKIISPTRYGQKVLKDRWVDLDVGVVPYGINHKIFHLPMQGKPKLKYDITSSYIGSPLEGYINIHNKFTAIYIGANQDRKNLGLIHETWREFEKGKEHDVTLLMFTHSVDLKQDIGAYDLFVFSSDTKTIKIINQTQPDGVIGQFLAASDILFHPSAGEGWGLTVSNAMACGTVPVVLPFAGVTDFCNDSNSYGIPYITHIGGYHVHRALTSVGNALEVLNEAYNNPQERLKKALQGIQDSKQYTWDNTADKLKENIEEVLKRDRNTIYVNCLIGE